ncbi:lysophospholipase [Scheffersomyces coipomensis]|uniref:lysophospholipase n=1 Tax=Scheffersomyces coipomensis TaxID=1788519 RepID=UPI00315D9FB5
MLYLAVLYLIATVLATSPTDGYAPGYVQCPSNSKLTRDATGLSSSESSWVQSRKEITNAALSTFLTNANLTDFDVDSFLSSNSPTIGLAFSGGGYRAMLTGAGELAALDSRTNSANSGLKGLLQSSTYLAGLSGGSWLVGSVALNDFISVDEIISQDTLWNLNNSILDPDGIDVIGNTLYWTAVSAEIAAKQLAGFKVTITDPWARTLSYQLLTNSNPLEGSALCYSDIVNLDSFQNHQAPFPIVVSDSRAPGQLLLDSNSTIFEFNPYEFGSWDPALYQFIPTQYIGSDLDGGVPVNSYACVKGFDNGGFVMGTSSSLFNEVILDVSQVDIPTFLSDLLSTFVLDPVTALSVDIAYYSPNPFYESTSGRGPNIFSENGTLYLVDGGEDGQNIPLAPLIQPNRNLDVIFAHDNSADTDENWPDGTSLVSTYQRQFLPIGNGTHFPYVPDQNTFLNLNLTSKPTFFGCDAQNLSSLTDNYLDVPLVVYIANRPFSYWTNTSTYKMAYSYEEKIGMIQNGYEIETRLNTTLDEEWAACVGCAIIRRSQERAGTEQSEQCQQCFAQYCWNGDIYTGDALGENYSNDGLTSGTEYYNSTNVAGISDGGLDLFKKKRSTIN